MKGARDMVLAPEDQALKVSYRALVKAFGGTDAAGEALGRRQQLVSDCTLPNTPQFATIRDVACLEDRTVGLPGWPMVTRALAQRQRMLLFPMPATVATGADLLGLLGRQSKESGELAASICAALADGKIVAGEVPTIRSELRDLIEVALAMDAALATIEAGESE